MSTWTPSSSLWQIRPNEQVERAYRPSCYESTPYFRDVGVDSTGRVYAVTGQNLYALAEHWSEEPRWVRTVADNLGRIAIDGNENIYAMGSTWIVKYDADGNLLGSWMLPGGNLWGIALNPGGTFYVVGYKVGAFTVWKAVGGVLVGFYDSGSRARSIDTDAAGFVYLAGHAASSILKINSAGVKVGELTLPSPEYPWEVDVDPAGNINIGGQQGAFGDYWVQQYDASFVWQWGYGLTDWTTSVRSGTDGRILVTTWDRAPLVQLLGSDGTFLWSWPNLWPEYGVGNGACFLGADVCVAGSKAAGWPWDAS